MFQTGKVGSVSSIRKTEWWMSEIVYVFIPGVRLVQAFPSKVSLLDIARNISYLACVTETHVNMNAAQNFQGIIILGNYLVGFAYLINLTEWSMCASEYVNIRGVRQLQVSEVRRHPTSVQIMPKTECEILSENVVNIRVVIDMRPTILLENSHDSVRLIQKKGWSV